MKFQYSVIGDNTQENREWLEKVGCVKFGLRKKAKYINTNYNKGWDKTFYYLCI